MTKSERGSGLGFLTGLLFGLALFFIDARRGFFFAGAAGDFFAAAFGFAALRDAALFVVLFVDLFAAAFGAADAERVVFLAGGFERRGLGDDPI